MKKDTPASIKNGFMNIYSVIRNLPDDEIFNTPEAVLHPHFEKLNRLGVMKIDDNEAQNLLCSEDFKPVIKKISHMKRTYGLRMEIKSARSIILSPDPWKAIKDFTFFPNYIELAHMEYKGGNLKSENRVVFLGSGPLPLSLICLCSQYSVKGIGIELIPEYAELSRKLIKTLELTEHIRIIQGNHFLLPLEQKIHLVMIGADAHPKNEIFTHLAGSLPESTKVSYRQAVTESNSPKFPPWSKYIKLQKPPPSFLLTGTENVINAEN